MESAVGFSVTVSGAWWASSLSPKVFEFLVFVSLAVKIFIQDGCWHFVVTLLLYSGLGQIDRLGTPDHSS